VYAWRDWYKALCFLIFSMAFIERPDMPNTMFGIVGLNPWNILFINVFLAYFANRNKGELHFPLPKKIKILLVFYLFVIFLSFFRAVYDLDGINNFRAYMSSLYGLDFYNKIKPKDLFIDDILNALKYFLPAILFYYGATTKKKISLGLLTISFLGLLLAIQVVKVMPMASLTDGTLLEKTGIRKIDRDIGYYRSDLAVLFGGVAWGLILIRPLFENPLLRGFLLFGSFITVLGMALTGGRIGMGSWIVVGSILAFYKMRSMFLLGPILVLIIITLVPAVHDRFTQGFSQEEQPGEVDYTSVTSGRTLVWPHIVEKIFEAPLIGYGKRAMQRIGLSEFLGRELNEAFPHPHNAYLQLLLDNGLLLGLPILYLYFLLFRYSFNLFRFKGKNDVIYNAAGGVALSMVTAHLVGCVGGQSFYPMTSSTGMWCALAIALRLYQDKNILSVPETSKQEANRQHSVRRQFY
jgi:O-antigen ligase